MLIPKWLVAVQFPQEYIKDRVRSSARLKDQEVWQEHSRYGNLTTFCTVSGCPDVGFEQTFISLRIIDIYFRFNEKSSTKIAALNRLAFPYIFYPQAFPPVPGSSIAAFLPGQTKPVTLERPA